MGATFGTGGCLYRYTDVPSSSYFTAMGWFKLTTDKNAYNNFLACGGYTAGDQHFELATDSDGTTLALWNADVLTNGSQLTVGTWYHLALVVDGTDIGNARVYLNGVLNITGDGNVIIPSQEFSISTSDVYLAGHAAGIKVYDAPLTATEIQQEMWSFLPVRTTSLHSFYPLYPGDLTTDYSGNGRTLTSSGSVSNGESPPVGLSLGQSIPWVVSGSATVDESVTLDWHGGVSETSQVNVKDAVTLAKSAGLAAEGVKQTTGIDEGITLGLILRVTPPQAQNINESVTLANQLGAGASSQVIAVEATSLTRYAGQGEAELGNVIASTSLPDKKFVTAGSGTNEKDGMTLARLSGQTSGSLANILAGLVLDWRGGLIVAGSKGGTEEAITLGVRRLLTTLVQTSVRDATTLAHIAALTAATQTNEKDGTVLDWHGGLTAQGVQAGGVEEAITLTIRRSIIAASGTNERDAALLAIHKGLMTVGVKAGGTDEAITLTRRAGISETSQVGAVGATTLAIRNYLTPSSQSVVSGTISLLDRFGLAETGLVRAFDSVSLVRTALQLAAGNYTQDESITIGIVLALIASTLPTRRVVLNVEPWSSILTLDERSNTFTLEPRSNALTLDERSDDLTLEPRSDGLTLEKREWI